MVQEPPRPRVRQLPNAHPGRRPVARTLPVQRVSLPQYLYQWLRATFGLTAAQAAGVLGNFQTESGFNPNAYNAGENAHGFAQWEGGRWTSLQTYAANHHLAATSVPAELGYLRQELTGGYSGALADLRRTTDPRAAAQVIQSEFEGSTIDSLPQRETNAAAIFARVSQGLDPIAGAARNVTIAGNQIRFPGESGISAAGFSGGAGGGGQAVKIPKLPFMVDQYPGHAPAAVIERMRAWLTKFWGGNIDWSHQSARSIIKNYNSTAAIATGPGTATVSSGGLLGTISHGIVTIGAAGGGAVLDAADAISGIPGQIVKWIEGLFSPLGRWITDAFVIVLGAVLVVIALWIVARSAGSTDTSSAPAAAAGGESTEHHEHHEHAAAGDAEAAGA